MFFKRDMCFPFCDKIHRIRGYSLCNIYLKNIMTIDFFKTNQEKVNIKDYIIKENNIFHSVQFGFDSILFRQDEITPFCNSMTTLYELYENFSAKIHIPLPQIGWKNKDNVRDKINEIFSDFIDTQAKYEIIDGVESLNFISLIIRKHINLLKNYNIHISDLVLQIECEDIENTILYFECPLYFEYIKENGLCFSQKQNEKTKVIYLKDCESLTYEQLDQAIAFDLFASMFGFHPNKVLEIHREAQKIRYLDTFEENS